VKRKICCGNAWLESRILAALSDQGANGIALPRLSRKEGLQASVWLTAEALRAQSKEFVIKKFSDLCELCVSVVNTPSQ
jgi:hypothetical protein